MQIVDLTHLDCFINTGEDVAADVHGFEAADCWKAMDAGLL